MCWKGIIVQNIGTFLEEKLYLSTLLNYFFHYFNIIDMHIMVALYNYRIGLQQLKRVKNREENGEIMPNNLAGTLIALSWSSCF